MYVVQVKVICNLCEEGFNSLQSWVQIYRLGAP